MPRASLFVSTADRQAWRRGGRGHFGMRARKFARSCGRLVAATMYCALFFTFMLFSLDITAQGTARFSVAMGLGPEVGWVAGAAFDFGKEVLLLALVRLWFKRSWLLFAVLSVAWLGL